MTPGFAESVGGGIEEPVRIVPFRGGVPPPQAGQAGPGQGAGVPGCPTPSFLFSGCTSRPRSTAGWRWAPTRCWRSRARGYRQSDVNLRDLYQIFSYGGFWAMARKHWKTSLPELRRSFDKRAFTRELQRLIPEIRSEDLVYSGAGVRAQAVSASGKLVDDLRDRRVRRRLSTCSMPRRPAPPRPWASPTPSAAPRRNTWHPEI